MSKIWIDQYGNEYERVEVTPYPEEWLHLHGKSLSGLHHSHQLRDGEDPDEPLHSHEGSEEGYLEQLSKEEIDNLKQARRDLRGVGAALYEISNLENY